MNLKRFTTREFWIELAVTETVTTGAVAGAGALMTVVAVIWAGLASLIAQAPVVAQLRRGATDLV